MGVLLLVTVTCNPKPKRPVALTPFNFVLACCAARKLLEGPWARAAVFTPGNADGLGWHAQSFRNSPDSYVL